MARPSAQARAASGAPTDELLNPATSQEATEATLHILRTATLIQRRVAPLTQQYGLSVAGFSVLEVLSSSDEPLAPSVISERLLVPAQTITRVIDSLERERWVRRQPHPTDRRSVLVTVTDRGRDLLHRVCTPVIAAEVEWLGALTPQEQRQLIDLLSRVQARLGDAPG